MLEPLVSDAKIACRWLRKSPGFALIAVASLAIGIGFNTALFALVDALLFRPLPVERPDRLVDVFTSGSDGDQYATTSYPDFTDFRSRNDVFTDILAYSPSLAAVKVGDRSRLALGEVVSGNYFQLLGVRAFAGRTLTPDDDRPGAPRVAAISYRTWRRDYGASPAAIGRALRLHGEAYTIIGVMPPAFTGMVPLLGPELWTPIAHVDDVEPAGIQSTVPSPSGSTRLDRRGQRWLFVKGRLKPGVGSDAAAADMRLIGRQLQTEYAPTNKDFDVSALPNVHIHPTADRMLRPIATGLMIVVGLVLVIACANVASMLLARASGRQREIGIRLAIGATRARLVQQLMAESAVMAALGASAGVALAWALAQAVMSIDLPIPIPLSFALQIDLRVLTFTAGVTLLTAFLAGLAPALRATRWSLVSGLKGDAPSTAVRGRRWSLRDGLVATQIAVTTVLVVAAALLTRSLVAAQRVGVGFDPSGVALVSTDLKMVGYDNARATQFFERALARMRAIPAVQSAALAQRTPFSINYNRNTLFVADRQTAADRGLTIDVTTVSPDYFATLGVPILQGRNFTAADTPASPRVVIINETMARKYWPGENAVGRRLRATTYNGRELEVIGVCADYKVSTVGEGATPYVHYAVSQRPDTGLGIIVRSRGDAGALLNAMRRELTALEPNIVFVEQQTLAGQVAATLLPAKAGAISVGAVGAVAMLLAATGLYGVIAYAVARRTREIGIRMALGARPAAVVALVMRQGLALAAVGVAVGSLVALGAAKAVAGALYGVTFVDPVAWSAAVVLLLAVAVLANVAPARRAAIVDPANALRAE